MLIPYPQSGAPWREIELVSDSQASLTATRDSVKLQLTNLQGGGQTNICWSGGSGGRAPQEIPCPEPTDLGHQTAGLVAPHSDLYLRGPCQEQTGF